MEGGPPPGGRGGRGEALRALIAQKQVCIRSLWHMSTMVYKHMFRIAFCNVEIFSSLISVLYGH